MYLQVVIATLLAVNASWYEVWQKFDIDPTIAEAVVWPEMQRYDRLQDYMETTAVTGSYVSKGCAGFDFSIGRFQMKPSFVENLEKGWMRSGLARQYDMWFDTADTADARRVRLSRLKKEEWQVIYIGVFLRLLYSSYGSYDKKGERSQDGIETLPPEDQVRIAATAYNRGCIWSAPGYGDWAQILAKSGEKHFHYATVPGKHTRRYCYAELALKHYRKLIKQ